MQNEDKKLLQKAMLGVKALPQNDRIFIKKRSKKQKSSFTNYATQNLEHQEQKIYFSDEYQPISSGGKIKFLRKNEDSQLLKRLARGYIEPEIFLDLHGLTKKQAKEELTALLTLCERKQLACICIITGYGTYALKRQLPNWLVQYAKLIAFCQAPRYFGGDAALFILLETKEYLSEKEKHGNY